MPNNPRTLQHSTPTDPTAQGPKPEYPQEAIAAPGLDSEMTPTADHGEESYHGLGRLKDRVALITGGDSGIGRAVALAFAREGADVVISYLPTEEPDAEETCHWIEQAGRRSLRLPGDIQDERHCETMIERAFAEFGRLDILVNNAAFQNTHDSIEEFTTEEFDRTFKTNVYAMFWLCRAALPRMQPGSVIINTASIQAYDPSPNLLAYAPTKGAIVNFTKALSQIAMKRRRARQRGRPGPRVDAPDPLDDARGEGEDVRAGHLVRARRPARGARPACTCSWPRTSRGSSRAKSTAPPAARRRY